MRSARTHDRLSKGYSRTDRIADSIHRSVARVLCETLKDPRVPRVTVSSVEVSRDLQHAKVFITLPEASKVDETLKLLNRAAGFFRSHLADAMHLRIVPKVRFVFDESVARAARIELLMKEQMGLDN